MVLFPDQLRGIAQRQAVCQLVAQVAAAGLQALHALLGGVLVIKADVDLGVAQIGGGIHAGDGDHGFLHARILDRAQQVCKLPLDLLVDSANSVGCHMAPPFGCKRILAGMKRPFGA